jgi:uncharacterized protein (TIGR02145 family)
VPKYIYEHKGYPKFTWDKVSVLLGKVLFQFGSIAIFAILGCSNNDDMSCSNPQQSDVVYGPSVTYGGETYETVVIGSQTWFKRNLNYDPNTGNSGCYDCDKYGRLYDWSTAMGISSNYNNSYFNPSENTKYRGICPSGWHIPNNAEWDKLVRYVDGTSGMENPYASPTAGRYLKATCGWKTYKGQSGNGDDKYGFSALPGGYGRNGNIDNIGFGNWWSSSEKSRYEAYQRIMFYTIDDVGYGYDNKSLLQSVRCLQD